MTEQEMRDSNVPTHDTLQELANYIETLQGQPHDYGTAVYAMSMAATAAFNYMASALGVTGFQASCADMDVIRRTRHIKGPFALVDISNALYPQYDLNGNLSEFIGKCKPWLKEQAAAKLAECEQPGSFGAHPDVIAHWKRLAA